MDAARYYLALLTVVSIPPGILSWFVIHPFAAIWRRAPTWLAYTVMALAVLPIAAVLFVFRKALLGVEYGFSWPLTVLAIGLYALATVIEVQCRRHLKLSILVGLPEISSKSGPGALLDQGIYGRMRHPRYVDIALGILAIALFTNYLAVYVLWLVCLGLIWLLAIIEERELRTRFGEAYVEYCGRVPRFVPRVDSSRSE